MPVLVAVVSLIGGAIWWWVRSNPRDAISVADDAITVARNAPRKLAFRRQTKVHPVEGIDDPKQAIVAIAHAFIGLDELPSREVRDMLNVLLRKNLKLSAEKSEEFNAVASFIQQQCGGADETISRVGRRLYKIDGDASWDVMTEILTDLSICDLGERQLQAIEDLRVALHHK